MSFLVEGAKDIVLVDTHGVLLTPKPGRYTHFSDRPIKEPYLKALEGYLINLKQDLLQTPPTYLDSIRGARLGLSSYYESIVDQSLPPLVDRWAGWNFLTADSFADSIQTFQELEGIEEYIPGQHDQYFDPYVISPERVADLKKLYNSGLSPILWSGMPHQSRAKFRYMLSPVKPYINGATLNPDTRNLSGTDAKLLFMGVLGYAVPEANVYPLDDDYGTALWLAYTYGIHVYLTVSQKEACNQPHMKTLSVPSYGQVQGLIHFDSTTDSILNDAGKQGFINRPQIRLLYHS